MNWKHLAGLTLLACAPAAQAGDHIFFAGPAPVAPETLFYSGLHDPEFFTDTLYVEVRPEDLALPGGPRGLLVHSDFVHHIDGLVYSIWSGSELLATFGDGGSWIDALGAGEYAVKISGQAVSVDGGSYGLSLQLAALPVPEPAAWLLLTGGLAVLALRRR
jgi:hypothetical protein